MEYLGIVLAVIGVWAWFRFGGSVGDYADMRIAEAQSVGKLHARVRMKREFEKAQKANKRGLESFDDLAEMLDGDFVSPNGTGGNQ